PVVGRVAAGAGGLDRPRSGNARRVVRGNPGGVDVGGGEPSADSPPAERSAGAPGALAGAGHAGGEAAGRFRRHAAGANAGGRGLRAFRRFGGARDGGLPAHAGRTERAPVVAPLPRPARGVGTWGGDTVPAGAGGTRAASGAALLKPEGVM